MLNTPKIVYSCDHNIVELKQNVLSEEHIKSPWDYDVICTDCTVTNVIALYQILTDLTVDYYETINFTKNADGMSIDWITGASRPLSGEVFTIEYLSSFISNVQYEAEDCPRCAGTGWYVGIFEERATVAKKATELTKLVQGFIKILLTTKTSTSNGYGSTLKDISGTEVYDSTSLSSSIVTTVLECETNFKLLQTTDINAGTLMADSEKLKSATVNSVEFDSTVGAVYVSITLLSEDSTQATLNLAL